MSQLPTIDPDRWNRVQDVFLSALEYEGDERRARLDACCGDDADLRAQVESLLESHDKGGPLDELKLDHFPAPQLSHLDGFTAEIADRYRIQRVLGAGGMATVYLAQDLRHFRDVAIKVLHPELAATLGADRFLREIRIAAGLRHPHILPLYDSGEADHLLYYVMPVENESLRHRLARDHTLRLDDALRIAREVLGALDYAHAQGVVHRDIKPENILLTEDHAIIADFGIARAIRAAGGERLTMAGLPVGTPAYMSPEQLLGDPNLDGRSDIYSVGCLLYEMLTGEPPFPGRASEHFDLRSLRGTVPPYIEHAIHKSLATDPDRRFATGSEFAAALPWPTTPVPAVTGPAEPAVPQSIAVLPFTNMTSDPENEYFSDGMTEEVINALTQLDNLHVVSRTSSFAFKGQTLDVAEVGARLRVGAVLEGSVRKAGNRLRVMAQLINVADGFHIWSERYDRELDDVFEIQDEIARTIADRLRVTLGKHTSAPLVKPPTKNIEAYQLYLKGRHLWNRRTREALEQAVQYFKDAIALDAGYALAYAGLADAYLLLGAYRHMSRRKAMTEARRATERALALDDTLPEAHATMGQILRSEFEWDAAAAAYARAIELNPKYATAHQWYATLLASLGRLDEAESEIRRAEELDPLSHAIAVTVANILFTGRRYDDALTQLQKALKLEPNFFSTHAWLSIVYGQLGRYDEAIDAARRAEALNPDNPNVLLGMAYAYAAQGDRDRTVEILEHAASRGAVAWIAMIYGVLGDLDAAFEWMDRATSIDAATEIALLSYVFPWFDPMRSDPRFARLLERVKLPA